MGSGYIAPQGRPPTDWAQRLFALRKRRGELPETTKEAADIALVVVLDAADNLLLIRRSKQNTRSGAWENPLGHSEAGETDLEAAQRELEEAGRPDRRVSPGDDHHPDPQWSEDHPLVCGTPPGIKPEVKLSAQRARSTPLGPSDRTLEGSPDEPPTGRRAPGTCSKSTTSLSR